MMISEAKVVILAKKLLSTKKSTFDGKLDFVRTSLPSPSVIGPVGAGAPRITVAALMENQNHY